MHTRIDILTDLFIKKRNSSLVLYFNRHLFAKYKCLYA
jgi:hypothetical protein